MGDLIGPSLKQSTLHNPNLPLWILPRAQFDFLLFLPSSPLKVGFFGSEQMIIPYQGTNFHGIFLKP
jgi:hypothetical protein